MYMVKRGLSTFPSPLPFGQAVGDKAAWWVRAEGEEVTGLKLREWRPGLLPQVRLCKGIWESEFSGYL